MILKRLWLILFAVGLAFMPFPVRAQSVDSIAKQLVCQCGCTAVLDNCTHGECMVRDTMLNQIRQKLDKGQSEAQIIQSFVAQYGEKVLASPPKRGFNLTAWITPFVAIIAGGTVIFFVLRKWAWRGKAAAETEEVSEAPEKDAEYERRLEKELKEFDMRGYR